MPHLPHIARLTKRLSVLALIRAAAHGRDDVVEYQPVGAAAPSAGSVFPVSALRWREVATVSKQFPRFLFAQVGILSQHLVAVLSPSALERGTHGGAGFRRMSVTLLAALAAGSGAFARADLVDGALIVGAPVERVAFAHHGTADTLAVSARHALVLSEQVVRAPVVQGSADAARDHFPGFLGWHGNSDNGVNSEDNSKILVQSLGVNSEPSHARNAQAPGVWKVQRLGGEDNNNPPTSAPAERQDIVWSAWRHAEAVHKQFRDNRNDETLNITPNSPISASRWDPKQYAAAVTMSGLEMLQNSGKEAIIDLMDARMDVAECQLVNAISSGVYSDGTGTGGKVITGLQAIVADTNTNTVGSISGSTWSFWRNVSWDASTDGGTAATSSNIQSYMNRTALQVVRGTEGPDLAVADTAYYRLFLESMQAIQRVYDEKMGAAGFAALKYYGAGRPVDVVLDGGMGGSCPANHMYFLNTKYLFFRPHRERNFTAIGGDRVPVNQDAVVKFIGWAGNLTCSGRKFQAVLKA